jgi:hypothetical protein
MFALTLALTWLPSLGAQSLRCVADSGRKAESVRGEIDRGKSFSATTKSGWILRLTPQPDGWVVRVSMKGRETDDLSRLTPPWHFVPNPRDLAGWHFRNKANTGPNDGTVNAPGAWRDFIFSPAVGREIEYQGSATTEADVDRVAAFGSGWLHVDDYRLTPPREGEQAAFTWLRFTACLTWRVADR